VYDRLATLGDPAGALSTRYELLRDSAEMIGSYPLFGSGLGTFEIVFPMFDRSARSGTAAHAENQYAEVLAELGVFGSVFVALLVLAVFLAWKRHVRRRSAPRVPLEVATAIGLGFGLCAVAIHATTDFGLEIPAIGVLTAVFGAVLLGLAARRTSTRPGARLTCAGICVAGAGWLLFLIPGAHSAREADELWRRVEGLQVELEELGPEASLPVYDEMVELARRAVLLQPDRVDFRYWRIVFEWSRAFRSEEATLPPEARRGIEATPALRAAAAAAQAELLELRHLAPTFGPLWSIAGQLGVRWLGDPDAARWIHRGRELAPHHPATCIASAVQLLREGDEAAALETFRRAIEMGARPRAVIEIFQLDLGRLDLALELARGDLGLLIHLDRLVTESGGEESLAAALRIELRDQLELACERHDAEPWMLSLLARRLVEEGEGAGAVALYRRYLNQVPDSPLRFDLARALVGLERIEEARQELRDLLAIEPGHEGARELLRTLDGS